MHDGFEARKGEIVVPIRRNQCMSRVLGGWDQKGREQEQTSGAEQPVIHRPVQPSIRYVGEPGTSSRKCVRLSTTVAMCAFSHVNHPPSAAWVVVLCCVPTCSESKLVVSHKGNQSESSQVTLSTPKTSRPLLSEVFNAGRDRFFRGLMTTSPQCFGTVPLPALRGGC